MSLDSIRSKLVRIDVQGIEVSVKKDFDIGEEYGLKAVALRINDNILDKLLQKVRLK